MSLSIGGIDLASSAINAELRLGVLEKIVDRLLRYAPEGALTDADLEAMRDETFAELQQKYPDAGLSKTAPEST